MVICPPELISAAVTIGAWANYTEPTEGVLAYILHEGFSFNLDSQLPRDGQEMRGKRDVLK